MKPSFWFGRGIGGLTSRRKSSKAAGRRGVEQLESRTMFNIAPPLVAITRPTITSGSDELALTGSFRYSVSDADGLSTVNVAITKTGEAAPVYTALHTNVPSVGPIDIPLSSLGLGEFTLTVNATDNAPPSDPDGQFSSSLSKTVTIFDDDVTAPVVTFIQPSVDPQGDGGSIPLSWTMSPDVAVARLVVTRDGTEIINELVAPGVAGTRAYGDAIGTYVAVMTVTDNDNDRPNDSLSSMSTKVIHVVDDDTTPPTVAFDHPRVDPQSDDLPGPVPFTWAMSVDVSRAHLTITHDGVTIVDEDVAPGDGMRDYGNELGLYVATLQVWDDDNDSPGDAATATATHQVTVIDDDVTPPTVALDYPRVDPVSDETPVALTWAYSVDVASAQLVVRRNGVVIFSGPAPASGTFDYGNQLGSYDATITVTDDDNDRAGDSLSASDTKSWSVVDDDTEAPTVDFDYPRVDPLTDEAVVALTWAYSVDVASAHLVVKRDGVVIFDGAAPAGGSFDFGNALGSYDATITVTDNDNDRIGDSLSAFATKSWSVVDDDTTGPEVTFNYPRADVLTTDDAERFFEWLAFDVSGFGAVQIQLTQDTGSGPVLIRDFAAGAAGTLDVVPFGIGTFTLTVIATDGDNDRPGDAATSTTSKTLVVNVPTPPPPPPPPDNLAERVADDLNPGKFKLVVNGTADDDCIFVKPSGQVFVNGVSQGTFSLTNVSRIVVYGNDGNDKIWTAGWITHDGDSDGCVFDRINIPTWLFGGNGNDLLVGGQKGGVIVGGNGYDLLIGGLGRDVMIGGRGGDAIIGVSADDILVAGYTTFDSNESALNSILKEWSRTDASYLTRVAHLSGTSSGGLNGSIYLRTDGSGQTVFDDGAYNEIDFLFGMDGTDWYLYNTGADGGRTDYVFGATSGETKSDIDMT